MSLQLNSWPLPDLSFVRIDGRSVSGAQSTSIRELIIEGQQRVNSEQDHSSPQSTEQILSGLHNQKANLCFAVVGSKTGVDSYIGASVDSHRQAILKSILGLNDERFLAKPVSVDLVRALISPLANHIGVVTGLPASGTAEKIGESELVEELVFGMQGRQFGFVVLAVPIPLHYINTEEFQLTDHIDQARRINDPKRGRDYEESLRKTRAYLEDIQLGSSIGLWQVGVYFFAPERGSFEQLKALISSCCTAEAALPLHTEEIDEPKVHLEQFGLIKNQVTSATSSLLAYKFLTPLNSRLLTAYVDLPVSRH